MPALFIMHCDSDPDLLCVPRYYIGGVLMPALSIWHVHGRGEVPACLPAKTALLHHSWAFCLGRGKNSNSDDMVT